MKWLVAAATLAVGAWPLSNAALAQAETRVHTVQPGETVQDIANAYGLSSATVLAANAASMADPDVLQVGQQLVIPPVDGVLHTVQPGETLGGIADQYGVATGDLVSANALHGSADDLGAGAVLIIPGATLAAHAVQSPPVAAVPPSQAVATVVSTPRADSGGTASTYVVQDGDTLRSIADANDLDILSLLAMNHLADPDLITPGTHLVIAAQPAEHVVQPGDTLGDIAWQYSVDANALLRANGLDNPDRLVTGMMLVIPTDASAAAAPPAPARAPAAAPTPATSPAQTSPGQASPAPAASRASAPAAPQPAAASAPSAAARVTTALVTGYALGAGAVSSHTASGTVTHWGTVAADTRLYPFGTRLRIEGLDDTVFTVEDTGSAVRGNVFDVWCPDAATARQLGARTRQVTILGSAGA